MKKEKIQELISQMTLEEKAGMCSGADFWHLKGIERLGIPQVMVTDGPHGIRKQAEAADHLGINESEKAVCFPAGGSECQHDPWTGNEHQTLPTMRKKFRVLF